MERVSNIADLKGIAPLLQKRRDSCPNFLCVEHCALQQECDVGDFCELRAVRPNKIPDLLNGPQLMKRWPMHHTVDKF
jgi:hypothetical protein